LWSVRYLLGKEVKLSNIISPAAIQACNQQYRPVSDLAAQAYARCNNVNTRWISLGSNQAALNQMQPDILGAANRILATFDAAYWAEKGWFGVTGLSALFPNDSSPVFDNGSFTAQDPNRPPLTGAAVNNVITRCQEFQNWLLSVAGAFNGTLQVNTATAVGTITGSGNATVIVTANAVTGSPITLSVAVLNTDTAATWAGKVRTALAANGPITAFYTVGGAGATITLTAITAAANDPSLNISLANGTCTGITATPNSVKTTAGVNPRGGVAWLNTVIQVSSYGPSPIVLADAGNFINRCTELIANYQASSNANLNILLAAAVNPNSNLNNSP
jgi:hypothetical protein